MTNTNTLLAVIVLAACGFVAQPSVAFAQEGEQDGQRASEGAPEEGQGEQPEENANADSEDDPNNAVTFGTIVNRDIDGSGYNWSGMGKCTAKRDAKTRKVTPGKPLWATKVGIHTTGSALWNTGDEALRGLAQGGTAYIQWTESRQTRKAMVYRDPDTGKTKEYDICANEPTGFWGVRLSANYFDVINTDAYGVGADVRLYPAGHQGFTFGFGATLAPDNAAFSQSTPVVTGVIGYDFESFASLIGRPAWDLRTNSFMVSAEISLNIDLLRENWPSTFEDLQP